MKAACGSGCDARRLSTGRSIRAGGTLCGRQMTRNTVPRGQLGRLVQMAAKIRRLAGNNKLDDDDAITPWGNSYRRLRETRNALLTMVVSQPKETKPK